MPHCPLIVGTSGASGGWRDWVRLPVAVEWIIRTGERSTQYSVTNKCLTVVDTTNGSEKNYRGVDAGHEQSRFDY